MAVRVADPGEKEAVLAQNAKGVFTMQHLDGYPAVLIQSNQAGKKATRDAMVDGSPAPR
jgi:hypothetical protein